MALRDGKEWLESVTLDEDNMVSDSDTDVVTQQSIVAYTNSVAGSNTAAMARYDIVEIDNTDSPYSMIDGEVLLVDTTAGAVIVTLPTAFEGRNVTIIHEQGGNNCTVNARAGEYIHGETGIVIGGSVGKGYPLTLTSVSMGGNDGWISMGTAARVLVGDGTVDSSYIPIVNVKQLTTDLSMSAETSITGSIDGFVLQSDAGASHATAIRSSNGHVYLFATCGSNAGSSNVYLRHEASGDQVEIKSSAVAHNFSIRFSGSSTNLFTADRTLNHVVVAGTTIDPISPVRLGNGTKPIPVYANNAAAITAGLGTGGVYRTATGTLMIRY